MFEIRYDEVGTTRAYIKSLNSMKACLKNINAYFNHRAINTPAKWERKDKYYQIKGRDRNSMVIDVKSKGLRLCDPISCAAMTVGEGKGCCLVSADIQMFCW